VEDATKIDKEHQKPAPKDTGLHFFSSKEALASLRANQAEMESFLLSTRKAQMKSIKQELREVVD